MLFFVIIHINTRRISKKKKEEFLCLIKFIIVISCFKDSWQVEMFCTIYTICIILNLLKSTQQKFNNLIQSVLRVYVYRYIRCFDPNIYTKKKTYLPSC